MPEQAPDHRRKDDPADATGESATTVPLVNRAEQVDPQLIPVGLEVIVPPPAPDFVTESVLAVNSAVTLFAWFIVTVQVEVPEQAPVQPTKIDPDVDVPGDAESVTDAPAVKS